MKIYFKTISMGEQGLLSCFKYTKPTLHLMFVEAPVWFATIDPHPLLTSFDTYYIGGDTEIVLELEVERMLECRGIKKAMDLFR